MTGTPYVVWLDDRHLVDCTGCGHHFSVAAPLDADRAFREMAPFHAPGCPVESPTRYHLRRAYQQAKASGRTAVLDGHPFTFAVPAEATGAVLGDLVQVEGAEYRIVRRMSLAANPDPNRTRLAILVRPGAMVRTRPDRRHVPRNHGGWPPAVRRRDPLRSTGVVHGLSISMGPGPSCGPFGGFGGPPPAAGASLVQRVAEETVAALTRAQRQRLHGRRA